MDGLKNLPLQTARGTVSQVMVKQRYVLRVEAWMLNVHVGHKYTYSMHMEC